MSPAGRKPLSEEGAKGNILKIRLTDEERAKLDAAATAEGKPTGTWLRDMGLAAAECQPQKPARRKRSDK